MSVSEASFVELCHFTALLLSVSVHNHGGVLAEEVVSVEQPVEVDGGDAHPVGSHSSQPPGVGLHDEVGIVKHQYNYRV